jgi:hypothetical protein
MQGNGDDDLEMLPQVTGWEKGDEDLSDDDNERSSDEDGLEWEEDEEDTEPVENASMALPSSYRMESINDLGLGDLTKQELELRRGHANDWLKELQMALGHKAVLYCTDM